MSDVSKVLEVMAAVQDVAVKLVKDVKSKSLATALMSVPPMIADITTILSDESLVMPELVGLDAEAVGKLGAAAYGMFVALLAAGVN